MTALGDKVRDKISGFQGIATGEHRYLNGCLRWSIEPPMDKDGKCITPHVFDDNQVEVVEAGVMPYVAIGKPPGGPHDEPSRQAAPNR